MEWFIAGILKKLSKKPDLIEVLLQAVCLFAWVGVVTRMLMRERIEMTLLKPPVIDISLLLSGHPVELTDFMLIIQKI